MALLWGGAVFGWSHSPARWGILLRVGQKRRWTFLSQPRLPSHTLYVNFQYIPVYYSFQLQCLIPIFTSRFCVCLHSTRLRDNMLKRIHYRKLSLLKCSFAKRSFRTRKIKITERFPINRWLVNIKRKKILPIFTEWAFFSFNKDGTTWTPN